MKLHLPVALLAAVLSTFAYGEETATTQPYSYTYVEKDGTGYSTFTGNGYGSLIADETSGAISAMNNYRNPNAGDPLYVSWKGAIGGIAANDHDDTAENVVIDVSGKDTWLSGVCGTGTTEYTITGDKTINITDGAYVQTVYGGSYERDVNTTGTTDSVTTISVSKGAMVTTILGGSFTSSNATGDLVTNDKVVINVNDAMVGVAKSGKTGELTYTAAEGLAIIGGSTFCSSINNDVEINVSGDSAVYGSIYAGTAAFRKQDASVNSTSVNINDGTVYGDVYGGGASGAYEASVLEGTKVAINGGTVTGNVYGAGSGDQIYGGTHVVVNGDATIHGDIYGGGIDGAEVKTGDRVITFDNHGEVDWTKVHDFDAVEFTGTTTTKLGADGQLAENYKKVTIDNSYITGSIGHEVELDVTNNIKVALDGNLTTGKGSDIVDNKNAITIAENATFNGTKIENSAIVAGGNIAVNSGSTVTNGNLVAADGDVSFSKSTMNGGEITVGGKLYVDRSDVTVDKINGADELQLKLQGGINGADSSLTIHDDVTLDANSSLFGIETKDYGGGAIIEGCRVTLTANSVTLDENIKGDAIYAATVNATKGDITIGAGNTVGASDLVAQGSVILKDGARLVDGEADISTATALTGDVVLSDVFQVRNSDLTAENGSVILESSTMEGGNIVAGEALVLSGSTATVDSINGGNAVKLDMTSAYVDGKLVGSNLNVNGDVVLANGSKIWGAETTEYPFFGKLEGCTSSLTADSITTGEGASDTLPVGAGDFMYAKLEATKGDISIGANNVIVDTDLTAANDVKLESSKMEGGNINAGGTLVLNNSVVSVNSIGTDGAFVDSNESTLEVTGGALVLNGDSDVKSVVKDSVLISKEGVELRGTTMTGSTVKTDGVFSVTKDSQVTMDSLEGLNNIHISDSSLSTEKLVVNKGETFNVTGVDREGDNLVLTGTGKSNDEALVVDGTMNVTDATLTIKGTNSQLGIGYGADGGVLNVTNSKVDVSEGTTLHIGYNANTSNSELNIKNSEFIGGSNNAWLGGGTINVTENSTMSVCSTKDDHYNYRVLMGLSGNTVNLNVNADSHFESNASQFVTNFNSDTNVNITVGKGSTFTQHAKINSSAPYGVTETITYLLDSGTDANGVKYAPVNNVYTTITAVDGGSVAFNSGVTYVGSALDQAENCTTKGLKLNVGKGSSMSFNDMEVYATTNVKNDGAFKAADINVHGGATFTYVGGGKMTASSLGVDKDGVMNLGSSDARGNVVLNNAGSGQTGIISGALNVTNTDLVVTGSSSSQFWIDGGTMTVDKGSKVDLSAGTTLRVGSENAGVLNVQGGSTLTGGANNLWVYDNSTINVSGKDSVMGVCNDTDHYNYRVLMGITNHNGAEGSATQAINVTEGGKFTSSATQFVTNFHSNTTTNITVSGENSLFHQTGQNVNNGHYVVGTTGEWVQNADGKWLDKGSAGVGGKYVTGNTDTITYLLSNGTDKDGVLGYAVSNANVNISAKDGGTVKFDSALTYVGNVGVSDAYIEANKSNKATFTVGDKASMSFKQMELYANTVICFEKPVSGDATSGSIGDIINGSNADKYTTGGSFSADKITVHAGTQLDVKGNGTDSGSQLILNGTGKSNDEALVVDGHMVVKNANLVMKGSSSQLGIGYNGNGTMEVINSKVDISEGSTLHMGYNAEYTGKLVLDNSQFVGGYNNAWLGGGELVLKNGSTMDVCNVAPKGTEYNYRTILGWDGHDMKVDISGGSTMTSAATQFITNYNSNTNVEIAVDGVGSKLTHKGETVTTKSSYKLGYSGEWVEKEVITGYKDGVAETKTVLADKDTVGRVNSGEGTRETVAYLLDSGTDEFGAKKAAVNNVTTTIKATNGGAVEFGSNKTYIGSVQDKALGYTNKHAYLSVDSKSSMSFGDMEIYADTTIDNQGTFKTGDVTVYDGATLENLGSLSLSDVALAGGELFNAGNLSITDSLELEHASLLFAATSLTDASAAINYTGTHLTNFGPNGSGVSIDDMVDNFGIVLTGAGAQQLIDAGETGVAFSFTLATGDATFLSELDTVLSIEENLADFSITVNDAILREGDGELKNLKVTVEGDALVISGTAIIPEPTTATLSLLALAALAARRRRK